ncbi:MAG TPA: hypothetical protein VJS39_13405 [Gemmatimonadaceae bacterium]|nr:hypothetical protein [Gemmatimonadaceae bacterium]
MMKFELATSAAIQQGGQATTPTPQAPTPPTPAQQQELRNAAQQLRDAIRQNVNHQLIQEQAQAAADKALQDQGVIVKTPPVPPVRGVFGRGPITIQTPDGNTTVIGTPRAGDQGIPPEAVDISIAFFFTVAAIVILLPLARAIARKMDRRSVQQVPPEVTAQLEHLNQAVDAIALEVERISEGQRFTTRLLTEQREGSPSLTTGANR